MIFALAIAAYVLLVMPGMVLAGRKVERLLRHYPLGNQEAAASSPENTAASR